MDIIARISLGCQTKEELLKLKDVYNEFVNHPNMLIKNGPRIMNEYFSR
jgi:hypothetical protein